MTRIFLKFFSQNEYQTKRILDFVGSQGVSLEKNLEDCEEIWFVGRLGKSPLGISKIEKESKLHRKKIRYFQVNQSGRYVGQGKEIPREKMHSGTIIPFN